MTRGHGYNNVRSQRLANQLCCYKIKIIHNNNYEASWLIESLHQRGVKNVLSSTKYIHITNKNIIYLIKTLINDY